ncbi:protein-L-isoaspartate O-methyltransferase [uncultured Methylobacterium sp.]|uniref:protein-L-isoaspartate O-methyltransferase family protein n=1 Tax=uncultured Methylobacterium sp. TaxID=157278 RepID=UPI0035CA40EE
MLDYAQARRLMVDCQLRTFDVNDVAVLDAFDAVPRERFVPPGSEPFAYIDRTLPLGGRDDDVRYLPASMLLARMIQALKIGSGVRVLDVGTGYGYAAALMARLGGRVTALEAVPALADAARARVDGARVDVIEGPLIAGAPGAGPFDAILVNGRVEVRPQALLDQLKDAGRLACVFGRDRAAKATLFVRAGDAFGARPLFDASLPALSEFREEAGFAF